MNAITESPRVRLTRTIESRFDQVDIVCREIRRLYEEASFHSAAFMAELLARECLNNAIIHGHGGTVGKHVRLQLRGRLGRLCLRVTDEGPGFDWRTVHWEAPEGSVRPVGRGLPILASYAERIRFNRQGNQVTLWLRSDRERS